MLDQYSAKKKKSGEGPIQKQQHNL